jgi:glutamate/tyrosine decarboxylase-like PLP-dependent enzyme
MLRGVVDPCLDHPSIRTSGHALLEAGCALVRRPEVLGPLTYIRPATSASRVHVDYGPQIHAPALSVALRHRGRGAGATISELLALSRAMAAAVDRHPELLLVSQALSITTFRYVPADLRSTVGESSTERHLDTLNRTLLDRLQKSGEVFVSNAVVNDRYALRACIVNFHTAQSDVEALPETVAELGRVIDAELRAKAQTA